jgi:hypothetical protein
MDKIIQILPNQLVTYNPDEFMPITRDGAVDNWPEFVKYKLRHVTKLLFAK